MFRVVTIGWVVSLLWMPQGVSAADWTMRLRYSGSQLEGKPLAWSKKRVMLLARDGKLWDLVPDRIRDYKRINSKFQGFSSVQMRGRLMREFGRQFEVSGTGHYLVVHPKGQRNLWAPRFEKIYRAFVVYFKVRGLRIPTPKVPLIAVVFPDQASYLAHARRQGTRIPKGWLGYYSRVSNRIMLYDITKKYKNPKLWHINADTIIHEAAHQLAFNTGVHSRFTPPPRWVAEGLGTLFEAPGIWNSVKHRTIRDRVNLGRLKDYRQYLKRRKPGSLAQFVSNDRPFRSDPTAAYAEAWALTFFLSEKYPQKYIRFLATTAGKQPFTSYPAAHRLKDFNQFFGPNLKIMESQLVRYMKTLPVK